MRRQPIFIDGRFVDARSNRDIKVLDPATQDQVATVADGDAADVAAAVAAARRAFDRGPWPETSAQERGRILLDLAGAVRRQAAELARLETLTSGKPIRESAADVAEAATCFEYYGGLATKIQGDVLPVPGEALNLALREPIGVAGQIVPWNYPLLLAAWKLAPVLCVGCTTVLKPAEQTPLTVLELARCFEEAGVPPGVVNIVTGRGMTGAALVAHPEVDKIAFTGSVETGKQVMRAAADSLKPLSLELGGKSPGIFFADADVERAVGGALFGAFANQGEVCSAGSRILVQRDLYRTFLDALVTRAQAIRLGPGLDPDTEMGPLVNRVHFERVRRYLDLGRAEAKLAVGGDRPTDGRLGKGFYIEPTIFHDVKAGARIAREEIFGPVACVIPFDDERDAIRMANETYYGLAASVWTRDLARALRVAKRLRAGIVWINDTQVSHVEAPWGGCKQSGFGRELGRWGAEAYLHVKQVHINLDEEAVLWPL